MKKILLASLLLISINAKAQISGYTAEKLINSGKFQKAETKISAVLQKNPEDCNANFAAYKLNSCQNYEKFNPETAYSYLEKSQNDFNNSDSKRRPKLSKQGYNETEFMNEFSKVSQFGLNIADQENTIEAYKHFLKFYQKANKEQKELAASNRNKLAFENALNKNTVESYTYFLNTYPDAAEAEEALRRRNALAYNRAAAIGTTKAFEDFINTYPNAEEVSSAWHNIYKIEYENVLKINTESAFRNYCAKYPQSPYAPQAEEKANLMQFANEVTPGDWLSYKNYINKHFNNKSIVKTAEIEILKLCEKSYEIQALDYLVENSEEYIRDTALIILHEIYAQSGERNSIINFYSKYDVSNCQRLSSIKEKEIQAVKELWYKDSEFIKAFAPNFLALKRLTSLISDNLKNKEWSKALKTVATYKKYFGTDYKYLNILNTLKTEYDKSIKINDIGSAINFKPGRQYSVAISADDKTILFCGQNRKDSNGGEDIFVSTKKNGVWTTSKPISDLNTKYGNEAPEALSADGTKLILFKNGKLCKSEKEKKGWSSPEVMPENINICSWQSDAMISSDGKAILFAAAQETPHEIQEGYSVYDHSNIYVSLLNEDGEWETPIDLGPMINTPFCDRAPFLHPDMKTLYFSSQGHGSLGGMDIFMTTRLSEDSWTQWSEPINLGKEINTIGDDCWYKISTDGKIAYFSKSTNENDKIMWLNLPERLRPNPVATISGQLCDKKGKAVSTSIRWEDLEENITVGQSQTDPVDGSFFIVLPMGKNYGYYINDDDYFPLANNIDLRGKNENIILEKKLEVASIKQMIEENIPMPLNNIFFAVGDSTLMTSSVAELTRVAELINKIGLKVEISGHTDDTGDFAKNQELSKARANSVYNFLISKGCNAQKLTSIGYGQTRPVASNKTAEGRQQNRRVEIRFLKN